jgi:hypothetical protein
MSTQSRDTNKANFVTGAKPTQNNFIDVFDSTKNIVDDGDSKWFLTTWQYTELSTGATSIILSGGSIPSGYLPVEVMTRTVVTFTSTASAITALTANLYSTNFGSQAVSPDIIVPLGSDVGTFVWGKANDNASRTFGTWVNATGYGIPWSENDPIDLRIQVKATGGNLNVLTAGEFEFWVLGRKLPSNPVSLHP